METGLNVRNIYGNERLYARIHEDAITLIESMGFNVSGLAADKIINAIPDGSADTIVYAQDLGKLYVTRSVIDAALDRVRQGMSYWPHGFGTGGMAAYIVDSQGPRPPELEDMVRLSKAYGQTDLLTNLQSSFNLTNQLRRSDIARRADLECAGIDAMIKYCDGKLITPTLLTEKAIHHLGELYQKGHKVATALSITSTYMTVSEEMTDPFLSIVQRGIPFLMNSMPIGGLTAPYSMSALATLAHAEAIFGLVLAQLIHPGILCINAAMPTIADMGKKDMPLMFGSRSNTMLNILIAELNDYLGIPSCQSACSHSRNQLDDQAMRESAETFCLTRHYHYHILRHLFGFSAQINDFSIGNMEIQIALYQDMIKNPIPVELPQPADYDREGLDAIFEGLACGDFRSLPHTLKNIGHSFL